MATRLQSVTFSRASMALVIEPETMRDLITFLQDEGETLGTLFGDDMETVVSSISTVPVATLEEAGVAPTPAEKPKRGRKPTEAVAPAPIPVPSAAPPSPPAPAAPLPPAALTLPADGGIPAFLARAEATPAPPAPPPLLPAAPTLVPAAPGGPVAQKVVKELERRAKDALDKGQALAVWLDEQCHIVKPGTSYAEAIITIATSVSEEKLKPVAQALQIET